MDLKQFNSRKISLISLVQTQLYLFHHAPDASDDQLDQLGEYWAAYDDLPVQLAKEGDTVVLESGLLVSK